LAVQRPELAGRLELVFAGRRTGSQQHSLEGLRGLPCRVVEYPYTDHKQAIDIMRSADALCVLLSDCTGAERVVPAKIFEYLATRLPILAITPAGELADLLRDHPAVDRLSPADVPGIAGVLARNIERHQPGRPLPVLSSDVGCYDRRAQAGELAGLLTALTDSRPSWTSSRRTSPPVLVPS
jgi:hypothetical protein